MRLKDRFHLLRKEKLGTEKQVALYSPRSSEMQVGRCCGEVPEPRDCQRRKTKAVKTKIFAGLKGDLNCILKDE